MFWLRMKKHKIFRYHDVLNGELHVVFVSMSGRRRAYACN